MDPVMCKTRKLNNWRIVILTNDIQIISGIRNVLHNREVIIHAKQISPTLSRFFRNGATPENEHWRL